MYFLGGGEVKVEHTFLLLLNTYIDVVRSCCGVLIGTVIMESERTSRAVCEDRRILHPNDSSQPPS